MITYICSVYLGPRKSRLSNRFWDNDPYCFIRKHLELLQTTDNKVVSKVIFVANHYNKLFELNLQSIVDSYQLKIPVEVRIRKNQGFSYAAWNETIKNELITKQVDKGYFFLIEDDYVPININVLTEMTKLLTPTIGYVCQVYEQDHAAISNGMMSVKVANAMYIKYGNVFDVKVSSSTYEQGTHNQVHFTDFLKDSNLEIIDIRSKYKSVFLESSDDSFKMFGQEDLPQSIIPIQTSELITFTKSPRDLNAVISTRNNYFYEYLVDNVKYSADEYNKLTDVIYTINYFGEPIGYIAVSRISKQNKFCYLEMCIDPLYTSMGIGSIALNNYIELQKKNYNKFIVEFPVDNVIAKRLADRMGFKYEALLHQHTLRDDKYFDTNIFVYFVKKESE